MTSSDSTFNKNQVQVHLINSFMQKSADFAFLLRSLKIIPVLDPRPKIWETGCRFLSSRGVVRKFVPKIPGEEGE